jgi:bacteriorhodopsin
MKLTSLLFGLTVAQTSTSGDVSVTTNADGSKNIDAGPGSVVNLGSSVTQDGAYAQATQEYGDMRGYMAEPQMCLSACPPHSPCMNKHTGACSPKMYYPEFHAQYAQYAQQGSYAQEGATQEGYGRHLSNGGCPRDTVDSNNLSVNKNWPLWTGFTLLVVPALWFLGGATRELMEDDATIQNRPGGLKMTIAGFICMVASLAYLTMATGHGFISRCCDARSFYYARYVDWAITTPLMLWELTQLAEDFSGNDYSTELWYLIFLDVLMIVSGLIGALMCNDDKWALFGFSMLCFIPILKQLCDFDADANANDAEVRKTYKAAMNITVLAWSVYPIIWICAEGTDILSANGEAIAYTTLDVIAKSFFGWVIVSRSMRQTP